MKMPKLVKWTDCLTSSGWQDEYNYDDSGYLFYGLTEEPEPAGRIDLSDKPKTERPKRSVPVRFISLD
jgi:hypothetical protein